MALTEETRVPRDDKEFYVLYAPQVRRLVWRLNRKQVASSDLPDVEAAVWERLITYGALKKYEVGRGTFPAYVNRIVYNASWNIRRARNRGRGIVNLVTPRPHTEEDTVETLDRLHHDHGEASTGNFTRSCLSEIDRKLAVYFTADERRSIYRRLVQEDACDFSSLVLSSGLDPDDIRSILASTDVRLPFMPCPRAWTTARK